MKPIKLIGQSYNGSVIENDVIDGNGQNCITLKDVSDVVVNVVEFNNANHFISVQDGCRNIRINNVRGDGAARNGIDLNGHNENILIQGFQFENVKGNGILARQNSQQFLDFENEPGLPFDQVNLQIKDGILVNVGWDGMHHPLYIQSQDVVIERMIIRGSKGTGISLRSTATVKDCIVMDTRKGIEYWPNHKAGVKPLLLENNIISQVESRPIWIALPADGKRTAGVYTKDVYVINNALPSAIVQDTDKIEVHSLGNEILSEIRLTELIFA